MTVITQTFHATGISSAPHPNPDQSPQLSTYASPVVSGTLRTRTQAQTDPSIRQCPLTHRCVGLKPTPPPASSAEDLSVTLGKHLGRHGADRAHHLSAERREVRGCLGEGPVRGWTRAALGQEEENGVKHGTFHISWVFRDRLQGAAANVPCSQRDPSLKSFFGD